MRLSRQLLVMAALTVLLGLGARVVQKHSVPLWGFPKPVELIQPKMAYAGAESVSVDSAFAPSDRPYEVNLSMVMGLYMKRKKSSVHFLDAREPDLYLEGHIPGARNVPFEQVAKYGDTLKTIPKTDLLLLYCDGGDCHQSHDLAEYLLANGWQRVAVYTGGWEEWSKETDFVEGKP
ncbi:MAG: rhodanese-like domain-containing protein [bacterium]|nr:rhodanese-like domain-containing protein [bacterium]